MSSDQFTWCMTPSFPPLPRPPRSVRPVHLRRGADRSAAVAQPQSGARPGILVGGLEYVHIRPTTRLGRSNCLPTSALFATPALVSPSTAGFGTTPAFAHAPRRTDPCAGTASTTIYGWSASLATLPRRDPHLST